MPDTSFVSTLLRIWFIVTFYNSGHGLDVKDFRSFVAFFSG